MNSFTGGSWGPYFVAHRSQLHRVPDGIDDRTAVLVDPIACGLHAVLRHRPADSEHWLIIGGGIIGLAVVAGIRAVGSRAHVTAIVRRREQAERMSAFGADDTLTISARASSAARYDAVAAHVGGRRIPIVFGNQAFVGGFDVVYDCVGTGRSLTDAMKFTRARGTVVAVGTSQIGVVETTPLWFSELTLLGASGRQIEDFEGRRQHTYEIVFDLIRAGRLRLDGLLTHTFPIRDYKAALHLLASRGRRGVVKAAFRHE
jgi:threonine dehydrogenase-like Zn-dependent dehydrogenase